MRQYKVPVPEFEACESCFTLFGFCFIKPSTTSGVKVPNAVPTMAVGTLYHTMLVYLDPEAFLTGLNDCQHLRPIFLVKLQIQLRLRPFYSPR